MKQRRAAIYARISSDPEGRRTGVERQVQDCRALAARLDMTVEDRHVFIDNDISATSLDTERPQWDAMLAAARSGEFMAILAYSTSRLTRAGSAGYLPLEALAASRGLEVHTVGTGQMQLDTADGQLSAGIMALFDRAEAKRTSERVKRAARQRAEQGQFHGGWPAFGYEAVKELVKGEERVVSWKTHPQHARWLREAARRVLAGETIYGITADWNRQGRLTGKGGVWQPRTLKRALLSPAVIGQREFEGRLIPAVWKPILDRETWDRLHDVLRERAGDTSRFDPKGNKRKYVLSGLVRCSDCGAVMRSMGASKAGAVGFVHPTVNSTSPDHPHHKRSDSRRIAMEPLEDWVIPQFLDYIDSPAVHRATAAPIDDELEDRRRSSREAIEDDRRRLEGLQDKLVDDLLDEAAFTKQRDRLLKRIRVNEEALAHITGIRPLDLPSAKDIRAMWDSADNTRKRELLAQFIDRIDVARATEGVPTRQSPRRGESSEEYGYRVAAHNADVMETRVKIVWRFR